MEVSLKGDLPKHRYSLFTHDCVPVYGSNTIIKFADDIMVVGLNKDDDESAYRDEVEHLVCRQQPGTKHPEDQGDHRRLQAG